MTLMRRLRTAPVLKHIMSGTRTVLLENLLGDSDLQLWDGVRRTAKNDIPAYTGMQLCAHSSPCAKLRFPWAVLPPHTCKVVPLSLRQVPAQCLSGVGKFWYTACKLEEDWPHPHYHLCLHQQYHVPPSAQEFRCPGNFGKAVKATKRNLDRGYIP